MNIAAIKGLELEYDVVGSGEPVLFISPVIADGFLPLMSEPSLTERYQLIRYHKRGWLGSTHTQGTVTVADHATDAVGLLDHLGVARAHVAGHSSGAAVAAQLALDSPDRVATLSLLELSLLSLPIGQAFVSQAGPVFEAYANGEHENAVAMFMSAVSGLDWPSCRRLLDKRLPGAVEQAIKDVDTFFGVEIPALAQWTFTAEQAATIDQPTLSLLGSDTGPLWIEVAEYLRSSLPHVEEHTIPGIGHLLQIQDGAPVARALAAFLDGYPISA